MNIQNKSEQKEAPPRRRRKKKRKLRIFRFIVIMFFILSFIGIAIGSTALFIIIKTAPPIDPAKATTLLEENSLIFDSDGKLLQKLTDPSEDRVIVPLSEIPKNLQNAVIAIEDERFLKHHGIDYKRVFGAFWHNIKTMNMSQGASTITMQMSKNIFTSAERTWTRKIQDAYYALEIEKKLSKEEILYIYLNTMGMQGNKVGVQASASGAFNKRVSDLTLAECAMLAGITKSPGRYAPFVLKRIEADDDLKSLQIQIIGYSNGPKPPSEEMLNLYTGLYKIGKVDRFEFNQLKNGESYALKAILNPKSKERQEIVLKKMLDLGMVSQTQYKEAVSEPIHIELGKRKASGISSYFVDILKGKVVKSLVDSGYTEQEAKTLLRNGGLRIYSTLNSSVQKGLEAVVASDKHFPGTFTDDAGIKQPQVSGVIINQSNGHVVALVGGRDIGGESIYNRAIRPRQPGSAIKPLSVYLPALQNGLTAGSVFSDNQIAEGDFKPRNYGNSYQGDMTMRYLLSKSSNTGTYRIAEKIGSTKEDSIHKMIESLKNLGITSIVTRDQNKKYNDESWSPLTLGGMTHGISPLQMAAAFAAIANEGVYNEPVFFTQITDANGKVLIKPQAITKTVSDSQDAFILTDMMKEVVKNGTGKPAALGSIPVAGKTGTTQDRFDSWFVGYTPYYTASVWIGVDVPKELEDTSRMAALLWKAIMAPIHKDLAVKDFSQPSGLVSRSISKSQGGLAGGYTTDAYTEIFKSGTEPTSYAPEPTPTELQLFPEEGTDPLTAPDSTTPNQSNGVIPVTPNPEGITPENPVQTPDTIVIPPSNNGNHGQGNGRGNGNKSSKPIVPIQGDTDTIVKPHDDTDSVVNP